MNFVLRFLYRLVPANPIVVNVVQSGSDRLQHLWIRMGYTGALILLVMIGLLTGEGLRGAVGLSDLAKNGSTVFQIIAYGQVIMICLLAPLFMAGAIAREQQGKTFDILLTTPLTNLQVVLGSLSGRLFLVLALLLSGLPLFSVLLIFGGVPVQSVFVAFAVAALTALMVGSVATTLAVLRIGGRKAVFVFVIGVVAYLVSFYALERFLVRPLSASPETTTWITPLHPLLVLESAVSPTTYHPSNAEQLVGRSGFARWYLSEPFWTFTTLTVSASALLLLWATINVRRIAQGQSDLVHRIKRFLRIRSAMGAERRHPPREVGKNPVAWRESHTRGHEAASILGRWGFAAIGLITAGVLMLMYHHGKLGDFGTAGAAGGAAGGMTAPEVFHTALSVLLLLELSVVVLVAIYMSAGAVSREREDGTLDLMLTTPITPKHYLWGKLRGLVSFLSLLIAVPVLTVAMVSVYSLVGRWLEWEQAVFQFTRPGRYGGGPVVADGALMLPEAPIWLLLTLVPFVAFCVMVGLTWSVKSKGVMGAVVPSLLIVGLVSVVLGFCGYSAAASVEGVGPVLNSFSPVTNMVTLVNPWQHLEGFAEDASVGRVALGIGAVIAAGGYALIVFGLLTAMVRGFDMTVRRLSGTG